MARKRQLDNPPANSSFDEKEDVCSDSESEGDGDNVVHGEKSEGHVKINTRVNKALASDSDSEGSMSGFTIRGINEESVGELHAKPKKGTANLGFKRSAEIETEPFELLKKKKKGCSTSVAVSPTVTVAVPGPAAYVEEDEGQKGFVAFQRWWSEADEIVILEGLREYKVKTGLDPSSDWNKFYNYIKDVLSVGISKNQLMDKIKKLKQKFRIKATKLESGGDLVFAKSHDSKIFKLSKKIWAELQDNDNDDGFSKGIGDKKEAKQNKNNTQNMMEECSHKPLTLGLARQGLLSSVKPNLDEPVGSIGIVDFADELEKGKGLAEEGKDMEKATDEVVVEETNFNLECRNADKPMMEEMEPVKIDEVVVEEEKVGDVEEFWINHSYLKEFLGMVNSLKSHGFEEAFYHENSRLIGVEKAKEMDEKWKKLKVEEIELQIKKFDLVKELMKLVCDAVKEKK